MLELFLQAGVALILMAALGKVFKALFGKEK